MEDIPDDTARSAVAPGGLPRTQIGRYLVMDRIGAGGMAEVFRARGPGGQQVVLKRIHPAISMRKGAVDMFLREARLALELHHENVVEVYEVGKDAEGLFIAMELLDGMPLNRLAKRFWSNDRQLALEPVVQMGAQVASGLAHAHGHGRPADAPRLVHRDISPDNLFLHRPLTSTGPSEPTRARNAMSPAVVKVLDFGVAKQLDAESLTRTGIIKGKLPFLAPEIIEGGEATPRSDLFALGVSLYWLIAGRRPFSGTDLKLMTAIVKDPAEPMRTHNDECPAQLDELVLTLLAKEPAERPVDAVEVASSLTAMLSDLPPWPAPGDLLDQAATLHGGLKLTNGWGSAPSVVWGSRGAQRAGSRPRPIPIEQQRTMTDPGDESSTGSRESVIFADDTQKAPPAPAPEAAADLTAEEPAIDEVGRHPLAPEPTQVRRPALVTHSDAAGEAAGQTELQGSLLESLPPVEEPGWAAEATVRGRPAPAPDIDATEDPSVDVSEISSADATVPSLPSHAGRLPVAEPPIQPLPFREETRIEPNVPAPDHSRSRLWPMVWIGLGLLGGLSINALLGGFDGEEIAVSVDDGRPANADVGSGRADIDREVDPPQGEVAELGAAGLAEDAPPTDELQRDDATGTDEAADELDVTKDPGPGAAGGDDEVESARTQVATARPTRRGRARRAPKTAGSSVSLRGPNSLRWQATDGKVLRRGAGRVSLSGGHRFVIAIDPKTGGKSRVPLVKGVADFRRLKKGELKVIARPWAEVSVGSLKLGPTPIAPTKLVEGRYRLKLEHPGAGGVAAVKYVQIEIKPGKTSTARVNLRRE